MNKIGWCEETWNPIIGCSKKSEGCVHCYAESFAKRLVMNPNPKVSDKYMSVIDPSGWTGRTHLEEKALNKPFHWKKPRMIFVCSMGDLFHESVPFEWIDSVYDMMGNCPQHIFMILTKRPDRALKYFNWFGENIKNIGYDSIPSESKNPLDYFDPLENVWLGTTVESDKYLYRIEDLLKIPAKVHFVSCEPLLGGIIIPNLQKINWIITGPETGHNARPCKKEWIESLYNQCKAAGVPFFDKKDILGLNLKELPI